MHLARAAVVGLLLLGGCIVGSALLHSEEVIGAVPVIVAYGGWRGLAEYRARHGRRR